MPTSSHHDKELSHEDWALAERVRELENQIAEIEDWKNQIQRYALFQFPTGALAYALKSGCENGEPMHYLCTSCMDKKQRSTLQPNGRYLRCPVCKVDIATQPRPPSQGNNRGGSWMSS
jgi:DNA-directed RNA polymerase subunit RPC12/RpoP